MNESIMQYIYNRAGGSILVREQWQSLNQMVRMKAKSTMGQMKAMKAGTLKAGTNASRNKCKPEQKAGTIYVTFAGYRNRGLMLREH